MILKINLVANLSIIKVFENQNKILQWLGYRFHGKGITKVGYYWGQDKRAILENIFLRKQFLEAIYLLKDLL